MMLINILIYVIISICIVLMIHNIINFLINTTTVRKNLDPVGVMNETYAKLHEKIHKTQESIQEQQENNLELNIDEEEKSNLLAWMSASSNDTMLFNSL